MGYDGNKCVLVERELLLDVSDHSVEVWVVYGAVVTGMVRVGSEQLPL